MAYSASRQSEPGFWEAEIVNIFFPQAQSQPQPTQDADLLRQLNFVPGLKELILLRQVHALEHATVWVLSSFRRATTRNSQVNSLDNELLGGMSTDRGFYLYGNVHSEDLSQAVQTALRRITAGEWDLAVHPRCGTNLSVGMTLTAGLALGSMFLMPRGPIEQLLGVGMAAVTAAYLTPELGTMVQRYVTTAIPFNLAIASITTLHDYWGRLAHFVEVRWVE